MTTDNQDHRGVMSRDGGAARIGDGSLGRSQQAEARLGKLEAETIQLREENASRRLGNTRLKFENQLLRDEIARLKNLIRPGEMK